MYSLCVLPIHPTLLFCACVCVCRCVADVFSHRGRDKICKQVLGSKEVLKMFDAGDCCVALSQGEAKLGQRYLAAVLPR